MYFLTTDRENWELQKRKGGPDWDIEIDLPVLQNPSVWIVYPSYIDKTRKTVHTEMITSLGPLNIIEGYKHHFYVNVSYLTKIPITILFCMNKVCARGFSPWLATPYVYDLISQMQLRRWYKHFIVLSLWKM